MTGVANLGFTDDDAPDESAWTDERTPPHELEAEQGALGGALLTRDAAEDVLETVRGKDFYIPKHEVLYDAIKALFERGEPTDVIAVTDELTKTALLQRAGGAEYLHTLTGLVPTAANAGYYASIVAEKAVLRRLVEAGTRIVQMGYASEGEPSTLVENARAEVEAITVIKAGSLRMIGEGLLDLARVLESAPTYQPTGWKALDFKIGGFAPGELHVVAARPSQGKSIVLLNAAMFAAQHGVVAFTSLEMKFDQLQLRLMSQYGEIHMKALRDHQLTDIDWNAYERAMRYVRGAGVFVDVTPSATISTIRAHVRAVAKRGKLSMILVDYLQLVDGPGASRELEVSGVARDLKKLALDFDVPVLVAAQLNRGTPSRGGTIPAPGMRDLRESGGIEANADGVLLLHRDDKKPSEIQFIVAKARQAEVGTVTMRWQPHYARVTDPIAQAHEPLFEMGMQ